MNSTLKSLADGNRFQRAYFRWAQPTYASLAPDQRELAEALDRHLYSREGLLTWAGVLCAIVGTALGLRGVGLPWAVATLLAAGGWSILLVFGVGAWLHPERVMDSARDRRKVLRLIAQAMVGAMLGAVCVMWLKWGHIDLVPQAPILRKFLLAIAPMALVVILGLGLLMLGIARTRQAVLQRQRDRARLEHERDAAAAQASEAQLRLLQAQIHPHFVFNTLAALQHWVDKTDPRAGPLLRELSAYLRAATEMLGKSQVSLGEELASVRHYLAIMQARWGERLRWETELEPGLEQQMLPPGLLLTLVENAVEHGLAHKLDGGLLSLSVRRDGAQGWRIEVADDGVGLGAAWQPGVGLANVRQRLEHFAGPGARFSLNPRAEGGCLARIELPLQ